MIDILQNPMFIAIVAGTLTYVYMWWTNDKKYAKNPEEKKPVNIYIPAIVTLVTWALVYGYYCTMENNSTIGVIGAGEEETAVLPQPKLTNQAFKLIEDKGPSIKDIDKASSDSVRSFQLVGRGLNIPNNLKMPDVFIETY
jgi:hypothetical protein